MYQCKTFLELVESEEDYDSKSVTAVGVLETIGCIVGELDQQEEVRIEGLLHTRWGTFRI